MSQTDRSPSAPNAITRRLFLARAAGLTLTLGAAGALEPSDAAALRRPYAGGVWLAGDHHIHTRYSDDGQYQIAEQVANAAKYGLGWCVITDHGGPHHDRVALEQAYPDLVAARRAHPEILVFQGLEWNMPDADHGSVILPPTEDEATRIARFEALYDADNRSDPAPHASTEADAVAGVRYLQQLQPRPIFIANHPARNGLDSPHEMRAWAEAGPDVVRGFEAAPGHQAGTLVGGWRGSYDSKQRPRSFPGYPPEAYRTFGGYDWFVAKVGGLWDALLAEGRPWYITADSDSHRHWDDLTVVDDSTYDTTGHTTPTNRRAARSDNEDFYPGEFAKTWVHAARRSHAAVLDAMRAGAMFTVMGDLIDRLEMAAWGPHAAAPMGGTLLLDRAGDDVTVTLRVRAPHRPNPGGRTPALHHVDLIAGDILGPAADRDTASNPTARVVAQIPAAKARRSGDMLEFRHRFPRVRQSFYVRARGASSAGEAPRQDTRTASPWDDVWFYGNPVMVRVPG